MTMPDETTVIVYNEEELQNAVSAASTADCIYLGADITIESGVTIDPGKTELIIDGTLNGTVFSLSNIQSTDSARTLGVRQASNLQLIIRNIRLIGNNYYGTPYVRETVNTDKVTVTYQNMTYIGKQVIFHQRGLTRFIDCDITITGSPDSQVEEVGEVCMVEIGGRTTITKDNREDSVFWFHGQSERRPYLKILSGADVNITTAHYFMYEHYQPDYIIEPESSFRLSTNTGISFDVSHTVASFTVGKNASFYYTQSAARGIASLCISGALTVEEGARFYMQADFANTSQLIRFTDSAGGLYVNNPRSFVLYNRGNNAATAFSFSSRISFVFSGNQVNYWGTPLLFPTAGSLDDPSPLKWNKPEWGLIQIEGRADSTDSYVDSHNFTDEELAQTSPMGDLKLHLPKTFSVGNLPLKMNRIVVGMRPIAGKTEVRAKVRIHCPAVGPYPDSEADDTGFFAVTQTEPVPFSEFFTVSANTPFLLTTLTEESQEEGGLSILSAPESIGFHPSPMSGFAQTILPRQITYDPVVVLDERSEKTEWVLWAKIDGPLKTDEDDVLENAVVFSSEDGELITLGTAFLPVHSDGWYVDDEHPVLWDEDRGVLARLTVPIRSGKRYQTQLGWTVYPVGVQPEGKD